MRWFRFYSEALDDPKVQRLPGELFKAWVNLLCLANDGTPRGALPSIEDIGFRLRLSPAKTRAIIDDLVSRGLIDADDETLQPHNWNDRQAKSDNVAERVQKHRAKQQEAVTRNVTYPLDVTTQKKTRVDTETEQSEKESKTTPAALAVVPSTTPFALVQAFCEEANQDISQASERWKSEHCGHAEALIAAGCSEPEFRRLVRYALSQTWRTSQVTPKTARGLYDDWVMAGRPDSEPPKAGGRRSKNDPDFSGIDTVVGMWKEAGR